MLWEIFPHSPFPLTAAPALAQVTDVTLPSVLPVPSLTPAALILIGTDMKRGCAQEGMNLRLLEMLSEEGRHSGEGESNSSARAEHPQGEGSQAPQPFWQSWQCLCSPAYTAGPCLELWKGLFSLGWLDGCFTFRSLNKQEMKRTSNKRASRAPHISLLRLGNSRVSSTEGWEFQGLCIPSCDPFLLSSSLLYSDYERTFCLTSVGNPLFQLPKSQTTT